VKSKDIKVGGFYSLKDGTVVRVDRAVLGTQTFEVWEKDGQEGFIVSSRALVAPAADPAPKAPVLANVPPRAKVVWASRDTRWDVYPQQEPVVLAAHNWDGWYLPQPDGSWFKAPGSFISAATLANPEEVFGQWELTASGGTVKYFVRDAGAYALLDIVR
jgi:hypothetical protein